MLLHYRECEVYLARLYRSREEEARRGRRGLLAQVDLDPIFPGLRLVGPSGKYEAGSLDPAVRDRLPTNTYNIVFQLAKWFPAEPRLYWFVGEMLNVAGAIDQAEGILNELAQTGMLTSFKDGARHRHVLDEARKAYAVFRKPSSQGMLLTELLLLTRPGLAPPVIGDAALVASSGVALGYGVHLDKDAPPPPPTTPPVVERPVAPPLPINFRHIAIAFGFGFLAAALLGFQWQEWRRRRLLAAQAQQTHQPAGPAQVGSAGPPGT